MARLFADHAIAAVVHCAGLKAVGESEARRLRTTTTTSVARSCWSRPWREAGVKTLVFSSSATVYGQPDRNPVTEDAPLRSASVYGRTKRIVEQLFEDAGRGRSAMAHRAAALLQSGRRARVGEIGEAPSRHPNNLVPHARAGRGRGPRGGFDLR